MYLLSLYFQNPAALGFSPLEAGLATLPATVGLVVVAPLVPRLAAEVRRPPGDRRRLRPHGRRVRRDRASSTRPGRTPRSCCRSSRSPSAWACPTVPRRRPRPRRVPENQVGGASGVSNMARYVGAAVATALAATIYGSVIANQHRRRRVAGRRPGLRPGRGLLGDGRVQLPRRPDGRRDRPAPRGAGARLNDAAAAAAAHPHTLPTSATAGRVAPSGLIRTPGRTRCPPPGGVRHAGAMAIQITGDAAADEVLDRQPVRAAGGDDARPAVPDGARVPRAGEGAGPVRHASSRRAIAAADPEEFAALCSDAAGDPPVPGLDGRPAAGAGPRSSRTVRRSRRAALDRGGRRARTCCKRVMALPGLRQAEGADLRRPARQAARRTPRGLGGGRRRLRRARATARSPTSSTRRRCRRCATSRRQKKAAAKAG